MQKFKYNQLVMYGMKNDNLKNREKELLFQLLRNSKLSDREIAKKLKTSQSTITRTRHKLENRFIQSYTVVPDLSRLDIRLIAFTFGSCPTPTPERKEKVDDFIVEQPNIVFAGHGEGLGKTGFIVSFHKDFSDYTDFVRKVRLECKGFGENIESFIVSTDKLLKTLNMAKAVESLIRK
jgi:DNA-binding Lrp family transcriptional regulator